MPRGNSEDFATTETDRLLPRYHLHSSSSSTTTTTARNSSSSCPSREIKTTRPAAYSSINSLFEKPTTNTPSIMMMHDEETGDEEIVSLVSGSGPAENHHVTTAAPTDAAAAAAAAAATNGKKRGSSPVHRRSSRRAGRPMEHVRTPSRRYDGEQAPPPSLMLRLTCLSVLTLVVIGSMGLLTYIQDKESPHPAVPVYEFIPSVEGTGASSSTTPHQEASFDNDELNSDSMVKHITGGDHSSTTTTALIDKDALKALMKEAGMVVEQRRSPPKKVHYNPQWTQENPFDFSEGSSNTVPVVGPNPLAPLFLASSSSSSSSGSKRSSAGDGLGYLQMPHLVQNQLVFCSQGDVFLTTVGQQQQQQQQEEYLPAVKLTTTVGNVLDPRLHPQLKYLAYTATYSGRRDIYLLDLLQANGGNGRAAAAAAPAVRLTYWDSSVGVSGLIGWWGDSALVFQAHSNEVSLPDTRLYVLHLQDNEGDDVPKGGGKKNDRRRTTVLRTLEDVMEQEEISKRSAAEATASSSSSSNYQRKSMLQIDPIPLSQARDAARYGDCWYFVRINQSSHTIRYVGGTAEKLYRYCDDASQADRLLWQDRYNGTSKAPQIYPNSNYLFFLSDRGRQAAAAAHNNNNNDGTWHPDRMNIWALPLSDDLKDHTGDKLIQITDTACDFEGRLIQEYSVDIHTGNMVVRIGADMYWMTADAIQAKLASSGKKNQNQNGRRRTIHNNNSNESRHLEAEAATAAASEWNISGGEEEEDAVDVMDDNSTTIEDLLGEDDTDNADKELIDMYDHEEVVADAVDVMDDTSTTIEDRLGEDDKDLGEDNNDLLGEDDTKDNADKELIDMDGGASLNETFTNETVGDNETVVDKVFYHYEAPALEARTFAEDTNTDHVTGSSAELTRLPIVVHSDFHTHQERLIPVDLLDHMTSADVYETAFGSLHFVMTLRGQLWVAPIEEDSTSSYMGAGRNMPGRRYRVAPGATMGGVVRILAVWHVPNPVEDASSDLRLAVILATDPLTETAEQAFYLIETQSSATPLFLDMEHLPKPFLGGHVSGGSTKEGGLGSVEATSVKISPCGRRMAWTDRDGRIVVMNLPHYQNMTNREVPEVVVLPQENEIGQPMVGEEAHLSFSPGGRYLAVEHNARNQFSVISIVDLGDPRGEDKVADIEIGRIVQATPDRFNSVSAYWGKSTADMHTYDRDVSMATLLGDDPPDDVATTLFFLSDRDISTDVKSPWGTRQPMPHFKKQKALFALPFYPKNSTTQREGPFSGGGASELKVDAMLARRQSIKAAMSATSSHRRSLLQNSLAGAFGLADDAFTARRVKGGSRRLEDGAAGTVENASSENNTTAEDDTLRAADFPQDMDIDFGPESDRTFSFARHAYRVATIPEANYIELLSQTPDDGSFVLIASEDDTESLVVYLADDYPSDEYVSKTFSPTSRKLANYGRSSCGRYLFFGFSPDGQHTVTANSGLGISRLLMDSELDENIVSARGIHLSVWPSLEYRQLYDDAWRMLRDYFYDADMTGIDWPVVHSRYLPLVSRCAKREELDDVLVQMASELSALHVFVYGGEYDSPMHGDRVLTMAHSVASLGATFQRAPEWKGYRITGIAERDPDFGLIDGNVQIYSPLSDNTLRLSGQRGLQVGDVIVGINGESVMHVPDIHMLLRGMAGNSVKLDVLRLASGEPLDSEGEDDGGDASVETVITVPITSFDADDLRYFAWEWKTRQLAEKLASDNGFSVGYVHLQDMSGPAAENAFARGFFPDYNKEAMILDVRHNRGGNIDSWVLDVLQRKAWMYWQSRDYNADNGGLGWDEQFAFRGHLVVLLDEKTSSDGEGLSRGISELGLGRLIGTRTWGGGIWLASDNHLVDGGIATAPEIGTYNDKFNWGLGIENMGVDPDIEVDNDLHQTYEGKDKQLETAIMELKRWLEAEPIVVPKPPERKKDMTMGEKECKR